VPRFFYFLGNMRRLLGFTVFELIVVIVVLSVLVGILVNFLDFTGYEKKKRVNKLLSDFFLIESAVQQYRVVTNSELVDSNGNGELLDESSLVPAYLFVPRVVQGFDSSYGVNGYSLKRYYDGNTGREGYYICVRASVSSTNDLTYQVMLEVQNVTAQGKVFINNTCGATSNYFTTGTVYETYWIYRNF